MAGCPRSNCTPQPGRRHRRPGAPGARLAARPAPGRPGLRVAACCAASCPRSCRPAGPVDEREQHEVAWALGELYTQAGRPELAALCRAAATHAIARGVALDAVASPAYRPAFWPPALYTLGTPTRRRPCRPGSCSPWPAPGRCWRRWATGSRSPTRAGCPGDGARARRPLPVDRGVPVDARRDEDRRPAAAVPARAPGWPSGCWRATGRRLAVTEAGVAGAWRHRAAVAGVVAARAALDPGVRARRARGDGGVAAARRGSFTPGRMTEEIDPGAGGEVAAGRAGPGEQRVRRRLGGRPGVVPARGAAGLVGHRPRPGRPAPQRVRGGGGRRGVPGRLPRATGRGGARRA